MYQYSVHLKILNKKLSVTDLSPTIMQAMDDYNQTGLHAVNHKQLSCFLPLSEREFSLTLSSQIDLGDNATRALRTFSGLIAKACPAIVFHSRVFDMCACPIAQTTAPTDLEVLSQVLSILKNKDTDYSAYHHLLETLF